MPQITAGHKALTTYYETLADLHAQGISNEGGLRRAFATLLVTLGRAEGWTLAEEQTLPGRIRPDGVLLDDLRFPRAHWEAKDTHDDLEVEIRKKLQLGYPQTNIIFEDGRTAILFQNRRRVAEADMRDRAQLALLLSQLFSHTEQQVEAFQQAVEVFRSRIPELAAQVEQAIEEERAKNQRFISAFEAFHQICRQAIDPTISADAIEKMLVQHLLTERLFRTVFDDPDFTRRNAIADEIERVIRSLTWNRNAFLKRLDPFYLAIEDAARTIDDYAQKQTFLNTVYERFFQGYSRDQADTHGVVYTPQPIVDFMVASVEQVLQRAFGKRLSDPGVCILDPATGTGNFIVNILRHIGATSRRDLKRKYQQELFANEIMLLPYYIASLNIEHAYHELTGEYAPFEGICFTDTLDLAESPQLSLFAEENTARVERQKSAAITVIIGNPPYNVGQMNENDNNKNRRYKDLDQRVRETYAKESRASNKNALSDVYVKFFRWAADRLRGQDGVVCFVSNNSFVDQLAFDGMRQQLLSDFNQIYHLDLHGNVRQNPKLSGTTHNVFGIQVGVGITIAARSSKQTERGLFYHRVPEEWTKLEKLEYLAVKGAVENITWQRLVPDARQTWLTDKLRGEYADFLPLGSKETKSGSQSDAATIFKNYGRGVATSRDDWAYGFSRAAVATNMRRMIEFYNTELDRWQRRSDRSVQVDQFVSYDDRQVKWSRDLKLDLQRGNPAQYSDQKIRNALYRPFCHQYLFFDRIMNEEVYQYPHFFPVPISEEENLAICVTGVGAERPFGTLVTKIIPDLNFFGPGTVPQWLPLYTYDEDGENRRENITDWALGEFQAAYGAHVTKRDIFDYVYALLHHPAYRERYAENLKRELPRVPLVAPAQFTPFVEAGRQLAALHLGYEQAAEHPLQWVEHHDVPFSWRVEKMRLSADKTSLTVNPSLTLAGIPPACFRYRLGNRSALEWVIDQYQVSTDKRSGIVSDPNRPGDEEYIVRLVGRVITVSLETMRIVDGLPPWDAAPAPGAAPALTAADV